MPYKKMKTKLFGKYREVFLDDKETTVRVTRKKEASTLAKIHFLKVNCSGSLASGLETS